MEIYRGNVDALGHRLEEGLGRRAVAIPPYQTVGPRLDPATRHVGALDGSDQQLFGMAADPALGVGVWATLYCEIDLQQAGAETYRDGPVSAGAWTEDELLDYHLTIALPDREVTRRWRNDLHVARQILTTTRQTAPPIFETAEPKAPVRDEAARERGGGEWLTLRRAVIQHLAPGDLLLKDGRFNCQIEMPAHWVDGLGRVARRSEVRAVAIVKSGALYREAYPVVRAIAERADRPFWFVAPTAMIEAAYANDKYIRKTLMIGGRDHTDLAGVGALWTVFCPDPRDFRTFVIVEFNVYDLFHYQELARAPEPLRDWHARLPGAFVRENGHVHVTDLLIDAERDLGGLVEPTLAEILWLCEAEIGRFGYPNLLGIAHHDVVLTRKKVDQLRRRYRDVLAWSDQILEELVANDFLESPHKIHHII